MTTLASGSSVSLTLANNGFLEVATNGGFGSVTITPVGGTATSESWGPSPFRKKYAGPYPEGAAVTLTNTSSPSFDYETDSSNLPIPVQSLVSGSPITLPNGTTVSLAAPPMLSSSGVPLVIPSSGSIGNNGALSGITAFTATYATAGMYLYFPAAAIAAGSAAGWYYTVMSSASTGTIYNNTYTSGTPRVPAVLVPFVTTGPGAYTQTTAAVDGVAITIAGGTLGASGVLYADGVLEANNSVNGKPFSVLFGGTQIGFKQMSSTNTGTFSSKVSNITASSQMLLASGSSLSGQYFAGGVSSGVVARSSVNTANDQTLLLRLKLDTATDWLMLSGYSVLTYYAA